MKKTIAFLVASMLLMCVSLATADAMIDPDKQSISLTGVGNSRELCGYACEDGRVVKPGLLLRTAALSNATEEDIRRLKDDYYLCVVVDLRMATEVESAPDPEIDGVKYPHLGIIYEETMTAINNRMKRALFNFPILLES